MANPTLNWKVNQSRGLITFDRLQPMTGNTYNLSVTGLPEGVVSTFYVMDESGDICLAKSAIVSSQMVIPFTSEALRNQFGKDWHEVRTFHCVCSSGTATIAEGDLEIVWNPVWTEPDISQAFSMKGPQGVGISAITFERTDTAGNFVYLITLTNGSTAEFTAPRGPVGMAANANYVKNSATNKYHQLIVRTNRFGEVTIDLDPNGVDNPGGGIATNYVTIDGIETIMGRKVFTGGLKSQTEIEGNVGGYSTYLKFARKFTIKDNDETNSQISDQSFDGSANFVLRLPSTIKANLTGSASKLATGRDFSITDNDGTNTATADTQFDGSADMTLKLPATIKANITGKVTGEVDATGSTAKVATPALDDSTTSKAVNVDWMNQKLVVLTETEYNNLATKNANTLYFIKE